MLGVSCEIGILKGLGHLSNQNISLSKTNVERLNSYKRKLYFNSMGEEFLTLNLK